MIKKIIIICFLCLIFVSVVLADNPYPAFFYGYRMNPLPANNIYGLLDNYPVINIENGISFSFEYSVNTENRQRKMTDQYDNIYKNTFISTSNSDINFNNLLIKINNFILSYRKEYDNDYSFQEKKTVQGNLFKTNNQQSKGNIKSWNLYYIFPEYKNLTVTAGLNYKELKNEIIFEEIFAYSIFNQFNYSLKSKFYDAAGIGTTIYLDYKLNLKTNFILSYKSSVTFDGYYTSDLNDVYGEENIENYNKSIKYPYELSLVSIFILPSEYFTKLYLTIAYQNWSSLKDAEQYNYPNDFDLNLNNILIYSAGIRYRINKKFDGGVSFLYEPSYLNNKSKKIGITVGTKYRLNEKINLNCVLNYTNFNLQYRYPFTINHSDGSRIELDEKDYYDNKDIRLNMGFEIKL